MEQEHHHNETKSFLIYIIFSMFALAGTLFNYFGNDKIYTMCFASYNKTYYARSEIEELKTLMIMHGISEKEIEHAINKAREKNLENIINP